MVTISLSDQCGKELCDNLRYRILLSEFEESLNNRFIYRNNIIIDKVRYKDFLNDVYEKFQEYNDYETSWDEAFKKALDSLLEQGTYVMQTCSSCNKTTILSWDEKGLYEIGEHKYCQECFYKATEDIVTCHKCGSDVLGSENPVIIHGDHYCNKCAAEIIAQQMQPKANS